MTPARADGIGDDDRDGDPGDDVAGAVPRPGSDAPLRAFVAVVALAGAAVLAGVVLATPAHELIGTRVRSAVIFAALLFVSELRPITWLRRRGGGDVTASWTFAVALLLVAGPAPALSATAAASALGDAVARKPPLRTVFNAAQLTLSLAAGWAVHELIDEPSALLAPDGPDLRWALAAALAAAAVFAVNTLLTSTALALDQHLPLTATLRAAWPIDLSTDGMLLALAPVFVVVAERSFLLAPLVVYATWTVYRGASDALARQHEATHDLLTDLPNRRLFYDEAALAVDDAERRATGLGLVLLDLNGFKAVNDQLGHQIGDLVLQEVAGRLQTAVRTGDLVARLGGDEFAVLVRSTGDVDTVVTVGRRLVDALDQPCTAAPFPLTVRGSVGVAVYPDHGADVDTLIRHADVAMYTAKQGQQGVHVYHDETDRHGVSRLNLVAELPRAMEHEELSVHYQPQIDLRSGRVAGVEALLRWQHPRHGWVAPDRFMPLAEHTDLMGPLTEYVLRRALAQAAAWSRLGLELTIAVNGSARNFHDVRFPSVVAALLEELGVAAARLELEITENAVMADPARTATVLAELRQMGVRVSMDDFGTGYSSLANLRRLPLDRVKIDRGFVLDMLDRDDDALIVRSIIELAGNLGLQTVAEGVEDGDVLEALSAYGCDTAQGFHVARPAPADRTTAWLLEASAGSDVA